MVNAVAQSVWRLDNSLVCPLTKLPLSLWPIGDAEKRMGGPLLPRADLLNARGGISRPFGCTPYVLVRQDLRCAFPILDGFPILLGPEMLVSEIGSVGFDLRDPKYAEAYEEMEFYNEEASREARHIAQSEAFAIVSMVTRASDSERASFPHPKSVWIDAVYDSASQFDAYRHLAPIRDGTVMQLGGKGIHAVKFLLGGAAEAWLITPMLGEARFALALATEAGVGDRLRCVVAVAEEIPLPSSTVDAIYAGGCLHHMHTAVALPEAARVLRPNGRFAAVEPWKAPLYTFGTKLLGKREANAYCRPLTGERLEPLGRAFGSSDVVQHGALTRYFLLALNKLGISLGLSEVWRINWLDDALSSMIPGARGMGSSVAVLGTRTCASSDAIAPTVSPLIVR